MFIALSRFFTIVIISLRYCIDQAILPKWLQLSRLYRKKLTDEQIGINITAWCIRLGPFFIKLGQNASMRDDLFPQKITHPLRSLQDKVPPFCLEKALAMIHENGSEHFSHICKEPLAAASVAQVHAAILDNNDQVVIKLLRPNIKTIIKRDIRMLRFFILIARLFSRQLRALPLQAFVDELQHTLFQEINLTNEAANCQSMQTQFTNDPNLRIPKIYWDYSSTQMLVMSKESGIKVTDLEALKAANINPAIIAKHCIDLFFTQLLKYRFFHADLHPGNIFIQPNIHKPNEPTLVLLDFGIVGTISEQDLMYIAGNLSAFIERDYLTVAKLHIEAGWMPNNIRIDQLEQAIRCISVPILSRPISKIAISSLLNQLILLAKRFKLNPQPQLILLQKTFFHIESLCRILDPQMQIWDLAKPHLDHYQLQYKFINKLPDISCLHKLITSYLKPDTNYHK